MRGNVYIKRTYIRGANYFVDCHQGSAKTIDPQTDSADSQFKYKQPLFQVMESKSILRRGCQPGKRKICGTVVALAFIIGCVLLAHTAFGEREKEGSLEKVFFVFRHGDRTPTETYPNDPYVNYDWPEGWGALTKKGMRQMYNLGQWIRKKYGWMTDYKYSKSSTIANSSYAERCILSAQAVLAGLYPENNAFVDGLPWRPILVNYLPKYMDKILVVGKKCPRLIHELKDAYRNESLKSDFILKSYYDELSKITGKKMDTITDIEFLYNTLEIEKMNGLQLPSAIQEHFNSEMRTIAARSYTLFTSNKIQQRLRGGPLLKHILEVMKYNTMNKKMYLYCTHDVYIISFLRAMGFTNELFKLDIGATLIFELLNISGDQSRQLRISMLNNTETKKPYVLKIPGCPNPCFLDNLFDVWKDVLPDNWDSECAEIPTQHSTVLK